VKEKIMRLAGKVAILTGAGSGIGKATALMFAKEGARIVVGGRRLEPLQNVVEAIRSEGGTADYCVMDVTKSEQVKNLVQTAVSEFGKLDIVFANAGINPLYTWLRMNPNGLQACFFRWKAAI